MTTRRGAREPTPWALLLLPLLLPLWAAAWMIGGKGIER